MATIGILSVDLALQSAQFMNGLKAASAASSQASQSISKAFNFAKGAAVGFLGALTVDWAKNQIQSAFDYADSIQDLADRTGASTKFIQEFGYAAQLTGSSVEGSRAGLEKFAKTMGMAELGNKAAQETLAKYGVTSRNVDTAVGQAADTISKYKDQTQKAAATAELFGKKNQDLTATMAGGSAGLSEMAAKAAELGIVIGDDLIKNAGQVNDQFDTMRMIISAEMAAAVVNNANAIASLAQGVTSLVVGLAQFWAQDPSKAMAIMGGIAGFAMGGPVGGLAGAVGGYYLGDKQAKANYAKNDKWRAADKLEQDARAARSKVAHAGASNETQNRFGAIVSKAMREKARIEAGLSDGSIVNTPRRAPAGGGKPTGVGTIEKPTGKGTPPKKTGSSGPSAEDIAKKEASRLEAYQRDLFRATDDEISAREALSTNIVHRAGFERELLANSTKREMDSIDADIANGKLKQAEGDALKTLVQKTNVSKLQLINNEQDDQLVQERLSIRNSQIDNERDQLSGQQQLSRSMKDRRNISLRIVDLEYQKEKLALEAVGDSHSASDAEKQIAAARLGILEGLKGQAVANAKKQTAGPLETYLDSIPASLDEVNEALENVQVEGLQSLSEGFKGLLTGAKSFGDVFSGVLDTVLDGILQIVIQQALIKPIGSLLSGDGGGGGGFLGGIFKSLVKGVAGASIGAVAPSSIGTAAFDTGSVNAFDITGIPSLSGARANGGLTRPGDYMVGERGKEIVRIGTAANVIPNHALKSMAGANDNSKAPTINFGDITSNDPAAIKMAAFQAIAEAMPMIRSQSADYTMAKLGRPGLR